MCKFFLKKTKKKKLMNKMKELTKWKGIDVHRLEDSILLKDD